jgi:ribonuclease BN (tRNA processing enzyme)
MNRLMIPGTASGQTAMGTGRPAACALVDMDGARVLVDAGPGCAAALAETLGAGRAAVDAVCLTHLQAGHVLDLGAVLHGIWLAGRAEPVRLFGPPGTARMLRGVMQALAYDTTLRHYTAGLPPFDAAVQVIETVPGGAEAWELGQGVVLDCLPVPHPPCEHVLAWRLRGSRRVVVVGDAAAHPPLAAFAQGADVLVHGAVNPDGLRARLAGTPGARHLAAAVEQVHATLEQVVALAQAAGVGRLVLSGLIPERGKRSEWMARGRLLWEGSLVVARDGEEFPL